MASAATAPTAVIAMTARFSVDGLPLSKRPENVKPPPQGLSSVAPATGCYCKREEKKNLVLVRERPLLPRIFRFTPLTIPSELGNANPNNGRGGSGALGDPARRGEAGAPLQAVLMRGDIPLRGGYNWLS